MLIMIKYFVIKNINMKMKKKKKKSMKKKKKKNRDKHFSLLKFSFLIKSMKLIRFIYKTCVNFIKIKITIKINVKTFMKCLLVIEKFSDSSIINIR